MDWWIVKQLRATILTDLHDFIPKNYFEREADRLKLHNGLKNSAHYSREFRWGYLASKLGKRLFFESTIIMSAKQVSASELLMNLGLLAIAEAIKGSTSQLSNNAKIKDVPDGNAGEVARQMEEQHIPTFIDNTRGALEQYLRYLTPLEAKPFLSLLESCQDEDKTADEHPNVSLLLKRMTTALEDDDPSGVLHASASIFETIAKDIVGIDSIQEKPLGAFFERYRIESMLPEEILNYIESIYKRRNTEPLAGHGSTRQPEITKEEAIILVEITKALIKCERLLKNEKQLFAINNCLTR